MQRRFASTLTMASRKGTGRFFKSMLRGGNLPRNKLVGNGVRGLDVSRVGVGGPMPGGLNQLILEDGLVSGVQAGANVVDIIPGYEGYIRMQLANTGRGRYVLLGSVPVKPDGSLDPVAQGVAGVLQKSGAPALDVLLLRRERDDSLDGVNAQALSREGLLATIEALERQVQERTIASYGVWTPALVLPSSDPRHVSVEDVLAAAVQVAGEDHHLSCVRTRMNLFQTELCTERNCAGNTMTTLEFCQSNSLDVYTDSAFQALDAAGDYVRFQSFVQHPEAEIAAEVRDAVDIAIQLEDEYEKLYAAHPRKSELPPVESMVFAKTIVANIDYLGNVARWQLALLMRFQPDLDEALRLVRRQKDLSEFAKNYNLAINYLYGTFGSMNAINERPLSEEMKQFLLDAYPKLSATMDTSNDTPMYYMSDDDEVDEEQQRLETRQAVEAQIKAKHARAAREAGKPEEALDEQELEQLVDAKVEEMENVSLIVERSFESLALHTYLATGVTSVLMHPKQLFHARETLFNYVNRNSFWDQASLLSRPQEAIDALSAFSKKFAG